MTTQADKAMEMLATRLLDTVEQRSSDRYGGITIRPAGNLLTISNWQPTDSPLNVGRILNLTMDKRGLGGSGKYALEESFLEKWESRENPSKHGVPPNTVGLIPFAALAERERQVELQRSTLTGGAGAVPTSVSVLGDAGLILARYAPILSRLEVKVGVHGGQKLPYLSTQGTAASNAEGGAVAVSTWAVDDTEYLPISVSSAFELTSSLRAVDDQTFENVVRFAVRQVLENEVLAQVLEGAGGTATPPEIAGLWGTTSLPVTDYGAADSDFTRSDVLSWYDSIRLSDSDGGRLTAVLGSGLWKLAQNVLRGGASSDKYLLEPLDYMGMGGSGAGMLEGAMAFHYSQLAPSGVTNPALAFAGDRVCLWFFGDALVLEYIPQLSAKDQYRMTAEVNAATVAPTKNAASIKQT
jgi:hypothetical protein